MTKRDLCNGMFGIVDDEDDIFVVVGKHLVYRDGLADFVDELREDLVFPSGRKITKLYEGRSFNQVELGSAKLIWNRAEAEKEAEKEAKVETDGITITEDQFFEAVKKANEKFFEIGGKTEGEGVVETMVGLQNILFGELLGIILFDKESE